MLQLNYALIFSFLACYVVLLTGHFEDLGYSGVKRALFFSLVPALTLIANLIWGHLADRFNLRVRFLKSFSLVGGISLYLLLLQDKFNAYLLMACFLGLFVFPLISLNDSLTISTCRNKNQSYGHFRQWGTLAFIFFNLSIWILFPLGKKWGLIGWHWLFFMPLLLLLFSCSSFQIKDLPVKNKSQPPVPLFSFFTHPTLRILFPAALLHNMAFVGNYAYFSPHLKGLGLTESFIALCWAIAPMGEFFLFRYAHRVLQRITPDTLFKMGLFSAFLRWLLLGFLQNPITILCSQVLHTFAFGAYFLAAMEILREDIPEHHRSFGQGVFTAFSMSLAMILGNALMGWIYDQGGTYLVFLCAAVIAATATLLSLFMPRRKFPDKPLPFIEEAVKSGRSLE